MRRPIRQLGAIAALGAGLVAVTAAAVALQSPAREESAESAAVVEPADMHNSAPVSSRPMSEVGPALDPDDLSSLPNVGIVVQADDAGYVVLVALDGAVLGHLDGYSLRPAAWPNQMLRGAGPLVLGRGDRAETLIDDRLVPVPGPAGALPLAAGSALVPGSSGRSLHLVLPTGAEEELPFGEVDVSADRSWVTARERNADTTHKRSTAYWLGGGEAVAVHLDAGCFAADDNGRVPILLCGNTIRIDDVVIHDGGPFPPVVVNGMEIISGHWTAAQLSDDGGALLLQYSGECESQSAWRLDLDDPDATPVALGPTDEAWDSGGLGWLPDRRVAAVFGPGVCGTAFPDGPGVYIEDASGEVALVYASPPGSTYLGALMWRQANSSADDERQRQSEAERTLTRIIQERERSGR